MLRALDEYIVGAEQRRGDPIGGVALLSLRWPIPAVGDVEARYQRVPLDDVPPTVTWRFWYTTPWPERLRRCADQP